MTKQQRLERLEALEESLKEMLGANKLLAEMEDLERRVNRLEMELVFSSPKIGEKPSRKSSETTQP